MGKHSQDRRRRSRRDLVTVSALAAGATAAGIAWVFLVRSAVDFGTLALGGQLEAWIFVVAASLGAVACLLVLMVLTVRSMRLLGLVHDAPRRRGARRSR